MKKSAFLVCLTLAFCSPLFAQSSPELEFSAGGDSASIQLIPQTNGTWSATPDTQVVLGNGVTFTLNSITVDPDPYVFYSYDVTNNTSGPMTYVASIPAVPASLAPGFYTVSSSLGISLTDANPGSSVSISPATAGSIQQGLIGANDVGVDLGTATVTNSVFGSTSTTNYAAGPFTYNLGSSADQISVTESFVLSPGASVGLSGFFNVQAVPEPSSIGFAVIAAGAFVVLLVRTRRARA